MNKAKQWAKMSASQKLVWNGFEGYCRGEKFQQNNLFLPRYQRRLLSKKQRKGESVAEF